MFKSGFFFLRQFVRSSVNFLAAVRPSRKIELDRLVALRKQHPNAPEHWLLALASNEAQAAGKLTSASLIETRSHPISAPSPLRAAAWPQVPFAPIAERSLPQTAGEPDGSPDAEFHLRHATREKTSLAPKFQQPKPKFLASWPINSDADVEAHLRRAPASSTASANHRPKRLRPSFTAKFTTAPQDSHAYQAFEPMPASSPASLAPPLLKFKPRIVSKHLHQEAKRPDINALASAKAPLNNIRGANSADPLPNQLGTNTELYAALSQVPAKNRDLQWTGKKCDVDEADISFIPLPGNAAEPMPLEHHATPRMKAETCFVDQQNNWPALPQHALNELPSQSDEGRLRQLIVAQERL